MLLKKYVKSRRKFKIFLLFIVLVLIVFTVLLLNPTASNVSLSSLVMGGRAERLLDERFVARAYAGEAQQQRALPAAEEPLLLKSPKENGVIVPEKYDEQKVRARISRDKLERLNARQKAGGGEPGDEHTPVLNEVLSAVHIFYSAPVNWYKSKKALHNNNIAQHEPNNEDNNNNNNNNDGAGAGVATQLPTPKPPRILNSAFYPALGLYKPTTKLLQQHFANIRNCGVGVLILSLTGKPGEVEVYQQILDLVPSFNLSVTFEISVASNQSVEYVRQQLLDVRRYVTSEGFYHVYSQSRDAAIPVIYISNAYKLAGETVADPKVGVIPTATERLFCSSNPDNLRQVFDAYFIGHIRLKNHAETMRRLCFEGFYSKLPSNGATFASTWKNWSFLKTFAMSYKMLFIPTVGPGFAERNKFPRHGDIQRHRSNGRYYGVAWRTAILNHVGFINIASYNNWPDGSQIEEVMPKAGFLDYNPATKTKYLDLTTHWVGNFLKTRLEAANSISAHLNCYELLNNTIC